MTHMDIKAIFIAGLLIGRKQEFLIEIEEVGWKRI